jgi:3-methyladenine DNA glycosylase AlkD
MKLQEALDRLKARGDESVRGLGVRDGAGENQFGVQLGDIRKLAKEIKTDHDLALELWKTRNVDARLLAILLLKPKLLSTAEVDRMVRSANVVQVAEWLNSYFVKSHPKKEELRERWMADDDPWAGRAGWSLTAERVAKSPEGLDLPALLDRIESEMRDADPAAQWTMNWCLLTIGIHSPKHRGRAVAIGEALGVYRDYPVSKGCTSPFAPIAIAEMVRRQG